MPLCIFDETNIHIHAVVVPVFFNQRWARYRMNADQIIGTPAKLRGLQTSYANALKHLGLKRGLEQSKSTHKSLQQFYSELTKSKQVSSLLGIESAVGTDPLAFRAWEQSLKILSDEVVQEIFTREQSLMAEIEYWKSRCNLRTVRHDGPVPKHSR